MTKPKVGALLEKITRIIPGIAGYQDRENRRAADLAVREKAAAEVSRCRAGLADSMNDLSRSGGMRNLRAIGNLERIVTRLERMEDEIRYAPSGYAGWFDRTGITLEDLERLYEVDLLLLETSVGLAGCVGQVEAVGTGQDWTGDLEQALDRLAEIFDGRRKSMEENG
ncbi:MAG: hypothetical protein P1S46_03795 [bacterium]|nr:hypothetical protein [bacterium]MDT8396053.1 hypothetical protein [bacterium]